MSTALSIIGFGDFWVLYELTGYIHLQKLGGAGKMCRTKASSGCPMLGKPKLQKNFRSQISQRGALDIEDLVHLGRNVGTCPYYGSRSMVQAADLIVLPYQSLLSKSSRESLGLVLKNSIVIIDEAHNLADSLISMYDSKITYSQVRLSALLSSVIHRNFKTLIRTKTTVPGYLI